MKEAYGYILIVAASIIWGTMGIFGTLAFQYDVDDVKNPHLIKHNVDSNSPVQERASQN